MTDTASLIIKVDSSGAAKATANLDRLDRSAGKSERAANKMGKAWGVAVGLISSAVIIGATRAFIQQADAFANMSAKLKLVTGSTQAATKAQRDLFDLSQRTSSDLQSTTDLYVKLGQSSKELAGNHTLLLGITEKVSKALVISGADAASSAAVIRQFSQAMAAGALRGDEFVSVMEGAPRLARAMADGLGVPIGALRKMAAEGKLTSDTVIKALEDQGAVIDREFGEMPITVGLATQQVRNALTQLIGDTDQASGASASLAKSIESLARVMESEDTKSAFATVVGGIASVISAAASATAGIGGLIGQYKAWLGESGRLGASADSDLSHLIARRDALSKAQSSRGGNGLAGANDPLGKLIGVDKIVRGELAKIDGLIAAKVKASGITVASMFPVPGVDVATPLARGGNRFNFAASQTAMASSRTSGLPSPALSASVGSRGDRASAAKKREMPSFLSEDTADLQKRIEAIARATDEFDRMAATLAGPLAEAEFQHKQNLADIDALAKESNKTDTERDALKAKEAERYGQEREAILARKTPAEEMLADMKFELELLGMTAIEREKAIAQRYAHVTAISAEGKAIGNMVEKLDKANAQDEGKNALKGLFVDVVTDVNNASDAVDNFFANLRQRAAQAIADKIFDSLFKTSGSGGDSGGGFWASLASAFFGGGKAGGGPVSGNRMYEVGEQGPEIFSSGGRKYMIPGRDGNVTPNNKIGGGGSYTINVNVPRNTSYQTAQQAGQAAYSGAARASRRNA